MKGREVKIERLLAAARTAPAPIVEPMPEYLQTRILAHCRENRPGDLFQSLAGALRLGLGAAFAIMIICVAWNYRDLALQPSNDVELVNVESHLDSQL